MDITLYDEKIESINATVESMLAEKAKLQKDKKKAEKTRGLKAGWIILLKAHRVQRKNF